ncbi:hypothetical protein PHMEG_00013943 [Phytophthora megakarya]|uniref:Uncharacterized protein n=1 Tax=Phytophthora megakarya TaxID=4795 RepID=A0A225W637_9STRA|nr:hypothetical protein PHMEG_00013943 [Phytophthora megakarya]
MTVFDLLQASNKISDLSKFDINTYLEKCGSDKGRCRHFQRVVPWTRSRVTSHKRANCMGISTKKKRVSMRNTRCSVYPLRSARVCLRIPNHVNKLERNQPLLRGKTK